MQYLMMVCLWCIGRKKYYFEIPNKLLTGHASGQQTVETTSNLGGYVNAGSETNEQLVIWQRFQDKILIKLKSYSCSK
jgi:hypothetical protein